MSESESHPLPPQQRRTRWNWRRWVLVGFLIAFLASVPAYFLLHPQLANSARESITKQLEDATGGKVEVGNVRVLPGRIIATNIRLYEATESEKLFADIESLEVGMPIYAMLNSEPSLSSIRITNGTFYLAFDEAGNPLNVFKPKNVQSSGMPARRVELHSSTIRLQQTGRETAELRRFMIKLHQQNNDLVDFVGHGGLLTSWWNFEGHFNPESIGLDISMHSDAATISAQRLWGMPFLPPIDESFVDFDGTSEVDLRFRFSEIEPFRYRVALNPDGVDLAIPIGGVDFQKVFGGILIEDGLITATQIDAAWVGGTATVNGTFDYNQYPCVGNLELSCSDASMNEFPELWALPDFVDGRLTAKGTLGLEVDETSTKLVAKADGVAAPLSIASLEANQSDVNIQLEEFNVSYLPSGEYTVVAMGDLNLQPEIKDRGISELAAQFAEMVGAEPPDWKTLNGRVSLKSTLHLPLETIEDWKTYSGSVETYSNAVQINQWLLEEIRLAGELEYGGILRLDDCLAMFNEGAVMAKMKVDPDSAEVVSGKLHVNNLAVKSLAESMSFDADGLDGELSSGLEFAFFNEREWHVFGSADSDLISFNEIDVIDVRSDVIIEPSGFRLLEVTAGGDQFSFKMPEASISFSDENQNQLVAEFEISNIDLKQQLQDTQLDDDRLIFERPLSVTGQVEGDLAKPQSVAVKGKGILPVAEWDGHVARDISFDWQLQDKELKVQNARAVAMGGVLDVATAIPVSGMDRIDELQVGFNEINLNALSKLIESNSPLEGVMSGSLSVSGMNSDEPSVRIEVNEASLFASGVRLTELQGKVALADGIVDLRSEGKVLDGKFDFSGQTPWEDLQAGKLRGQLNVQQVDLRRLAAESPQLAVLKPLAGKANASFTLNPDVNTTRNSNRAANLFQGDGTINFQKVGWNNAELVGQIQSRVSVNGGILQINAIDAKLFQGQATGSVVYDLLGRSTGRFELNLSRVDLEKWMKAIPELSDVDPGNADLRIAGLIGNAITGRGQLKTNRVDISGVSAESIRGNFRFRFEPKSGAGKILGSGVTMRMADGRVTSDFVYGWGPTSQLKLDARLERIDAGKLLKSTQVASNLRKGQLSGQVKVEGRNIRSFRDLQGSFRGQLKQTQALRLPVLDEVARFASTGQIGNLPYDSEEIELNLSRGTLEVKKLNLKGELAQLTVEGSIRSGQRLDLEVTVHAGRSQSDQQLARLFNIGVAVSSGGIPLGLLAEINNLLSERLVFLKVSGTVSRPQIKLQAQRQLGQEVALFFLNNSFGGNFPLGNLR